MTTNTKDYSINKPNFAIQSNNNLSIIQRKLFNHFIYEFKLVNYANFINLDRENLSKILCKKYSHSQITEILKGMQTSLLITNNDNLFKVYKGVQYIGSVCIFKNQYKISMDMMLLNYLNLNKKNLEVNNKNIIHGYTKLNLNIINNLEGKHTIPFYELSKCLSFKKNTFNLSFEYLYNFLVKDKDTYENFKSFNQKVLKPAITEINKKTDIFVKFKLIKKGTKVISIDFFVFENNKEMIA